MIIYAHAFAESGTLLRDTRIAPGDHSQVRLNVSPTRGTDCDAFGWPCHGVTVGIFGEEPTLVDSIERGIIVQ